jgi:succinate-semialdehyde dehydrogenase/glutarate-semialdehyde dehydrogenase
MATEAVAIRKQVISRNPATGETLASFDCATGEDVSQAVLWARSAQPGWAALEVRQRVKILRSFQDLLLARKQDVAGLISREAGKPYAEALVTEVLVVLDAARYCTQSAPAFLRPEPVPHANLLLKAKSGRLIRQPHGVIGIVAPWNYPLSIPATETLAALVTGNAVILKPSEFTTLVACELRKLLHEAGVPPGIVQVLPGDGATGASLLASPIDKLIFTGSVPTGKRVAQAAAARLLPVVVELGVKDPMIVLEDANVEVAASAAVWGAFMNAGQTCISVERCYVHEKIYDRFAAACAEKTSKLRIGNGLAPDTDVGPMIHEGQLKIVESQVEEARREGAQVVAGGRRLPDLGPHFYAPTIIVGVNHSMRLMREETFGPVLPIMPFANDEEALKLANDSDFGLSGSIWTRNRKRGQALARRLNTGTVMINDVISGFAIAEAPHGGLKDSGLGRTHGRLGMEEMVRVKYVDSDRLSGLSKVWWYGYGAAFAWQIENFSDFLFSRRTWTRLRGGVRSLPALFRRRL